MPKEQLIGSYLVRFSERRRHKHILLQNLKTGEQLEFETWYSAWSFLEQVLEEGQLPLAPQKMKKIGGETD